MDEKLEKLISIDTFIGQLFVMSRKMESLIEEHDDVKSTMTQDQREAIEEIKTQLHETLARL